MLYFGHEVWVGVQLFAAVAFAGAVHVCSLWGVKVWMVQHAVWIR